jgi:alpha-beta hydrolase superfamily lysophospholipase
MQHIEGNFIGVRNTNMYHQAWLPEGDPKAVLLIVHGLGEHSGRYMNVVNHFVPLGYAAYALDHIGHGKSGGKREIVKEFEDFTGTLTIFCQMVSGWQPGVPVFLLGHSLGGLIVSYYLLDHQAYFKGAVISAPAIKISESITPFTITLGRVMAKLLPGMGLLGLDASTICRDPQVVSAYVDDPLVFHAKTPACLAAVVLDGMLRVNTEAEEIKLPFIVLQGSDDKLVDPRGAQTLYDGASSKDKTIKMYPGLYHEVFNEPERAQVLADVESWLAAHL